MDGITLKLTTLSGTTEALQPKSGNALTMQDNTTAIFTAHVVARRTDIVGDHAGYLLSGVLCRENGPQTVNLINSTTELLAETSGATGWTCSGTVDTSNGILQIDVTGEENKTIDWVAAIHAVDSSW